MTVNINILSIKVKTDAHENSVVGWENNWLKIKIKATPEKGRANQVVRKLLAKQARVGVNEINIISGLASKRKKILLPSESLIYFKNNYKKKNPTN